MSIVTRKFAILFLASSTSVSTASASTPDSANERNRVLAEALFNDGRALGEQGQWTQACVKFQESQRLDPALGTLLHLATCYAETGKTASAWISFKMAIDLAKQNQDTAREKVALKRAADLEQKLSYLTLRVSGNVEGLTLFFDDKPLETAILSTPIPLDPGTYHLVAESSTKRRWETDIEVMIGPSQRTIDIPDLSEKRTTVAPSRTISMPAPAPSAVQTSQNAHSIAGPLLLGVGSVGIVMGTYFGFRASAQADEADKNCQGAVCTQPGLDGHARANRSAWASNIGFGLGLASLAGGFYLTIIHPTGTTQGRKMQLHATADQLRLTGSF